MVSQDLAVSRRLRRARVVVRFTLDLGVALVALPVALLLRFDGAVPNVVERIVPQLLVAAVALQALSLLLVSGPRRLWRYTSFREYLSLGIAAVGGTAGLLLVVFVRYPIVPKSAVLIHGALMIIGLAGLRVARRLQLAVARRRQLGDAARVRTLVVGAGDTAAALLRDWESQFRPFWEVVGLLDDSALKRGLRINGLPVMGPTTDLEYVIRRESIKHVIVAMPGAQKAVIRGIIGRAQAQGATVQAVPGLEQLRNNRRGGATGTVTLEDLMESAEVKRTFLARVRPAGERDLILVTGGAGYIGSHLVRQLLADGYRVRVLDNFTYGDGALSGFRGDPRLEVVNGDISSIRDVVSVTKDASIVVALAAIVGDPACGINAEETLNLNYEATKVLVEAANFYGVQRLVFASSCSVYGAADDQLLTESSALNPVSLYARTRILSEDVLFDRCGDVEPVVLRLSTVFGLSTRMRFDLVVNAMTARASVERRIQVFGGDQWRPFVHCSDAARAFMLAATRPAEAVKGQVFNIGSTDMNFTIAQIADLVAEVVGPDVQVLTMDSSEDRRNYRVSFDKARTRLNFVPRMDLRRGVAEMAQAIKQRDGLRNFEDPAFSNLKVLRDRFESVHEISTPPEGMTPVRVAVVR